MRHHLIILFLIAASVANSSAASPTSAEIQQWFERAGYPLLVVDSPQTHDGLSTAKMLQSKNPTRDLYWLDMRKSRLIHLVGGEIAYLQPAARFGGGLYDPEPIMILRPSKKLACFDATRRTIENVVDIMDLDNDGVSEIIGSEGGGKGGYNFFARSLFQVKECETHILHKAIDEDNEGAWGRNSWRYHGRFVQWEFVDINKDGINDLRETRVIEEGRAAREPVTTKTVYRYVFVNGSIIRYLDYLKEHPHRN